MATGIDILKNVSLKEHNNFGLGGVARYFCLVSSSDEVIEAIEISKKLKTQYYVLGGGYNVVFSDNDFDGLIIKIKGGHIRQDGDKVYCDAGISLSELIGFTISKGMSGLESLSGIPGTVGGAIYGNAGAYGHSISEVIESVRVFDGDKIRKISKNDCKFEYRESLFKKNKWIITEVEMVFGKADKKELEKISSNIIEIRNKKFPWDLKCPGSYFKNVFVLSLSKKVLSNIDQGRIIEGKIPAGYLLEQVGAKGMADGGAKVTDFHGNIIINTGNAKYSEVKNLSGKLKKLVFEKFEINLEEEVQYIN
ncbi:MAG: UDP-N-acetylmuramate dehydrogenase [Bacteroidota bacterium]